jgi:hypothetical protein
MHIVAELYVIHLYKCPFHGRINISM